MVSFCYLFWSKNVVKTVCFCVFLLRGPFWSLFGIFCLFLVGLGGHLGSPWCPHGVLLGVLLLSLWSLWGPVGSLWEPLGTHVLLWGSFWGSCGILGTLCGSLGGPVGSILGILWHPFGNFLGSLGVYRALPPVGTLFGSLGGPVGNILGILWHPFGNFLGTLGGRPDWGSLVILWGFLGTLCEPFVGTQGGRQTHRHTDRTRPDQTTDQTRG